LLVVLASAAVVALLEPGPAADAADCFRCFPGGTTGAAWGFGSTCQAATNDAVNQARNQIPGTCDQCGSETVISLEPCNTSCTNTATCYTPYGEWRVDVKLRYKCSVDLCQ